MTTRTRGVGGWFVAALVVALTSGCERSPADRVADYCDVWCTCLAPLPAQRHACVAECEQELASYAPQLTEACVGCVESFECGPTWRDDVQEACYPVCGGGD